MDETFMLFLNDIPAENQGFVLELDNYLTSKGSKRTIKSAKSGFVTSYASPVTGKTLLNYVFRKSGVKMRIYAASIGEHADILSDIPDNMKKDIIKAGECKKLNGLKCSPTCGGGYTFTLDGEEYKKCKNMAFFHALTEENYDAIMKLIRSELGDM
ncbi:MAG: hypothetical protein PUD20_07105 [bacterium]|nr:hypothetical protein [bacterium]